MPHIVACVYAKLINDILKTITLHLRENGNELENTITSLWQEMSLWVYFFRDQTSQVDVEFYKY